MNNMFSDSEIKAIEKVKDHKTLEVYFFDKIVIGKNTKWLDLLKKYGFFDNSRIPVLSDGNYVEEWNVLNYLISIMDTLIIENNEKQIYYTLEILMHVAEKSLNFRIFTQSISILIKIPVKYYTGKYINTFFDYWIGCAYENEFILFEIESKFLPFIIKYDKNSALIVFKKFINRFDRYVPQSYHILDRLIQNESLLKKLFQDNEMEIIKCICGLLEKVLFKESAKRDINGESIYINTLENNRYRLSLNNKVILEDEFINRSQDTETIEKCILNLNTSLTFEDIQRTVRLLYGDLFYENAYESIFDEKDFIHELDDYLLVILKKFLNYTIETDMLIRITDYLKVSSYDLVIKLLIYCFKTKWIQMEEYFYLLLESNTDLFDYIFRNYIFDDETKNIFEIINSKISLKYRKIIMNILDKGEYIKHDWKDDDFELIWMQKRLYSLIKIPYFKKKYQELHKLTGKDVFLAPSMRFSGVHTIEQKSPLTREEIISMTNIELIKIMGNFRELERFSMDFTNISYKGFGEEIKEVVKVNPDRFLNDLLLFNKLQYEFIYYLLEGFSELVGSNIELSYDKLIDFLILYTQSQSFWDNSYRYEQNNEYLMDFKGFLKEVFRFLKRYIENDKLNFNETIYKKIVLLLIRSIDKCDVVKIEEVLFSNKDFSFYTINSLNGVIIIAILELSLKIKRIGLKNYKLLWNKDIKALIERLFKIKCIDVYIIFGEYIGYFAYIDKQWVEEKIKMIDLNSDMWEFFITGYLESRTVYGEYYILLKEHYLKAMDYQGFFDGNTKKRLGSHLVIGFLNGFEEKIENVLINKLFEIWDIDIIEELIRYCYAVDKKIFVKEVTIKQIKEKTLFLWSKIVDKYSIPQETINEADKNLIRSTIHLLNNFDLLNKEIAKNLRFCYTYLSGSFNTYYIVDFFESIINKQKSEKQIKMIIPLMEEFLEVLYPSYPEEKIIELLNFLKEKGEQERLDDILKVYLDKTRKSFVVEHINKIR